MSIKKVAPAPAHARERAKVVKTKDGFKVVEGTLTVFQDPRKQAADNFATVENIRLARNAANRTKHKKKLWEVRLYVGPADGFLKARLLAQKNINEYLRGLVEADFDRRFDDGKPRPADCVDKDLAKKRAKSITAYYNEDGSIRQIQVIARDPFEVGLYDSWDAVNAMLAGEIQGQRP